MYILFRDFSFVFKLNVLYILQLQDKATLLTSERKKRGKSVPEELAKPDQIRQFQTLASHPVSFCININFILIAKILIYDR